MSRSNPVTRGRATSERGPLRLWRRATRRSTGAAAIAFATIAGVLVSGSVADATPTYKYYTAAVTPAPPSTIYVGVASPVTVTLDNLSISNQPFGSAELVIGGVPADDVVLGQPATNQHVTDVSGWSATFASTTPSAVILLTSVNGASIQPGSSLNIYLTIKPPTDSSVPITTVVKQANNFSGTGNNFNLQGSAPTIDVAGVTLTFASPGQEPSTVQQYSSSAPANSVINMCQPVSVYVSANGNPVSDVVVTLAKAGTSDPGLVWEGQAVSSLNTPTATSAANGIATFGSCASGLGAMNIGTGYTLNASSLAASVPVSSTSFSVVQSYLRCSVGTCDSSPITSSVNGTSGYSNTTFGAAGQLLGSFGLGNNLESSCTSQVTNSKVTVDPLVSQASVNSAAQGTVTMTFPKSVVNNLANNGTPLMQVCAGASQPFPGSNSLADPLPGPYPFQGLVADCGTSYTTIVDNICVLSRSKHAANEIIEIWVYDLSDPSYW